MYAVLAEAGLVSAARGGCPGGGGVGLGPALSLAPGISLLNIEHASSIYLTRLKLAFLEHPLLWQPDLCMPRAPFLRALLQDLCVCP